MEDPRTPRDDKTVESDKNVEVVGKPTESDDSVVQSETSKSPSFRDIIESKLTGKRRDAALLFCAGMGSMTGISRACGVSRDTVHRWKREDGWDGLRKLVGESFEARAFDGLTEFKEGLIKEIREDIELIDKKKGSVKPNSLEGLLKVKDLLLSRLMLLMGEATKREEHIFVRFGDPVELPRERRVKAIQPGAENESCHLSSGREGDREDGAGKPGEQSSNGPPENRPPSDKAEGQGSGEAREKRKEPEKVVVLRPSGGSRETRRLARRRALGIDKEKETESGT